MSVSHDADDEYEYEQRVSEEDSRSVHEDPSVRPTLFVWLLTFSAGISGLLFGCKILLQAQLINRRANFLLLQTTQASSPRPWSPSAHPSQNIH